VVFQTDYDEIELKKESVMTSSKNVTRFFHVRPLPIKISGYVSDFSQRKRGLFIKTEDF